MADKKITAITLENYRAFYGKYGQFQMPKGENVFIYGENGSGKSSLFEGMKQFFAASRRGFNTATLEENIWHTKERNLNATTSELVITCVFGDVIRTPQIPGSTVQNNFILTNLSPYKLTRPDHSSPVNQSQNQSFILNAQMVRAFLSYKDLLPVYSPAPQGRPQKNQFGLMVNMLKDIPVGSETLGSLYSKLENFNKGDRRIVSYRNTNIPQLIQTFNSEMTRVLNDIKTLGQLDKILGDNSFFGHSIEIEFEFRGLNFAGGRGKGQRLFQKELYFKVKFNEESIESYQFYYQDFLNEARLSALAVTLFLAAMKANPPQTDYKILFLDDIFIGLDMSNRLPLLRVINDLFPDYQVFVTTYDRHWFNVAKKRLEDWGGNWKFFEMYEGEGEMGGGRKIPMPVVMPSKDYLAVATDYLAKKDYPACANYLRKKFEEKLKSLLPENEQVKFSEREDKSKPRHLLQELWDAFKEYSKKDNQDIDLTPIKELEHHKEFLLNPLSHDNLDTPVYMRELQECIALLAKLDEYSIKKILEAGARLKFSFTNAGRYWSFKLELLENLRLITVPGHTVKISKCKCRVIEADDNGSVSQPGWENTVVNFYTTKQGAFYQPNPVPANSPDEWSIQEVLSGQELRDFITTV